ncbi:MAG: beta-lactamase family protein [Thermomicrobiales bacterium]|nr:beta-lactamase family protein [Thermomicrobiales bacterium]
MTDATHHALNRRTLLQASVAGALATTLGVAGRPAAAQDATPLALDAAEGFSPEIQLALHQIVARNLAATETPGALVGVWCPGQGEWQHAAGIADLETGAPVTLDDHVRIASNTKTFVATVVLQLVDEGLVGLDDPIEAYVPGIPNGPAITVRQVLGMSAGIADFIAVPEIAAEYAANPLIAMTPEDILAWIRESTPDFVPGAKVHYSNSNYVILGCLIEAVTGNSPELEITSRLIAPLGLTGTSFPLTPSMPQPAMHGYFAESLGDPLIDVTRSNPGFPWTSGAMIATLADMRTWVRELASGKAMLSAATLAERNTWGDLAPGAGYGLGILNLRGFLGHNGGIAGYSSWMLCNPENGFTVVIVVNRAGEKGGTADPFLADILQLFPEVVAAPEAAPAATPAA